MSIRMRMKDDVFTLIFQQNLLKGLQKNCQKKENIQQTTVLKMLRGGQW